MPAFKITLIDQLRKSREFFKNNSIFLKTNVILKIGTTKRSTEYMCNFEN